MTAHEQFFLIAASCTATLEPCMLPAAYLHTVTSVAICLFGSLLVKGVFMSCQAHG